jgi:hypothetical protein
MTTLYELSGQYLALAELADDPNMPPEALQDSLEGLEGAIEVKAQALLQVVAGMEGDTGAIDAEIKRLQERKRVIENRANRLRQYLFDNMQATGISKISCPLFAITLAKGRPVVVIDDASQIPPQYIKTTITETPIKAEILKALKAGEAVPGCYLGESKQSLRIR